MVIVTISSAMLSMQGEQPVWKEAWHGIRQCVRAPQRTATGRRVSGDSGTRPGRRYRQQCRRFRQRRELGPFPSLVAPGQARPSAVPGLLGVAGGDLRSDRSLEQSAYAALESTTDLHPRYLEQLYTFGGPTRSMADCPWYPSCTGRSSARPRPRASRTVTTYDGSPKTNCPSWRSTIARSSTTRCSACAPKSNTRRGHPTARPHVHPAPTARRL